MPIRKRIHLRHAFLTRQDMLGSEKGMAEMTARERQELIERFSRAEDLLGRLEEAHRNPLEDFTYEEYRTLPDVSMGCGRMHVAVQPPALCDLTRHDLALRGVGAR